TLRSPARVWLPTARRRTPPRPVIPMTLGPPSTAYSESRSKAPVALCRSPTQRLLDPDSHGPEIDACRPRIILLRAERFRIGFQHREKSGTLRSVGGVKAVQRPPVE